MIKTDSLTAYLMAKFVHREEEKNYDSTLHFALSNAHRVLREKYGIEGRDELPEIAFTAAGEMIAHKIKHEIEKATEHLASTLALAHEIGTRSTPRKRKKLKKMAEKAVAYEQIKLGIISNAVDVVDFAYIAEVLMDIGKRKASEAAVSSAAGKESAGE